MLNLQDVATSILCSLKPEIWIIADPNFTFLEKSKISISSKAYPEYLIIN